MLDRQIRIEPAAPPAARARTRTVQRTPAERQRAAEVNEKDRAERAHRQAIKAQGLAELTGAELDAFLAVEFPGLRKLAARMAYLERTELMTRCARFAERVRRSEFAQEHRRIEAMTPEQFEAYRRAEIKRLTPPLEPFVWDAKKSGADNIAALRQWERERDKRQWATA